MCEGHLSTSACSPTAGILLKYHFSSKWQGYWDGKSMETRGFIPHPFIFVSHASLLFYKDIGMAYAASCFSIPISRHLYALCSISYRKLVIAVTLLTSFYVTTFLAVRKVVQGCSQTYFPTTVLSTLAHIASPYIPDRRSSIAAMDCSCF